MKFYYNKLRMILNEKGIKKAFVQKSLNIAASTLWYWEKGIKTPAENNVRKLSKLLGIEVSEISDLKEKKLDNEKYDKITDSIQSNNWLEQSLTSHTEHQNSHNYFVNRINKVFKELSESKIILSALLNNMEINFYIKNHSNKYITANDKFIETMKLNKGYNVYGKKDSNLMSREDAVENCTEDELLIRNNKKVVYEGYIPNTRKKKWAVIIKIPILDEGGNVFGLSATYTDITERKITEQRINILDSAISQSNVAVTICNINSKNKNRYPYLSKSIEKIYGYTRDNFTKEKMFFWKHCIHSDDYDRVMKIYEENTFPETYEYRIITKSKKVKWLKANVTPIQYKNMQCLLFIETDITTEKKSMEQAELLHFLSEEMTDNITIRDVTNKILYENKAAEQITGYPINKFREKDSGMEFWIYNCVHPEDRELELKYLRNNSYPCLSRYRLVNKNGEIIWVERAITKKKYNNRECYIAVTRDITELKKSEELKTLLEVNINLMSDAIVIADIESDRILYVNKMTEKIFGISREEFLRSARADIMEKFVDKNSIGDIENFQNTEKRCIRYKTTINSKTKWIESRRSIVDYLGKKCLLSIFNDITEFHDAKEIIKMLYDATAGLKNAIVWLIEDYVLKDLEKIKVKFVSDSVEKILGYSKNELYNDSSLFFNKIILDKDIYRKDRIEIINEFQDNFLYNRNPCRILTKTGEIKWIESNCSIVFHNNKKYYLFINFDITERIESQKSNSKIKLDIAIKLYKKGIDPDIITETTGISKKQITINQ